MINRRKFLQLSALLPGLSLTPELFATQNGQNPPLLILIELKGGNDGLNTLIPVEESHYYRLRPSLAIPANAALKIGDGFAMHPALQPLMANWKNGDLAWLHGLGYDDPNRSHFRSTEIWESGSASNEYDAQGWVSKLYPQTTQHLNGIVVGSDVGPLNNSQFDTIVMDNAKTFTNLTKRLQKVHGQTTNPALAHVLGVQNNIRQNAGRVIEVLQKSQRVDVAFPGNVFGRRLKQVAHLINNNLGASIYKVELGSFDTHREQARRHQNLLTQLAQGLSAFSEAIKQSGQWQNTLIMTYSEFGRRAAQNKSGGTDHGTAAAHFVMGGRVRGGFHGTPPDLARLQNGDLRHTADFRGLYHSVATQWLGRPSPWKNFGTFDLIHSA